MVSQFNDVIAQKLFAAAADDADSPEIEPGTVGFQKEKLLGYLSELKVGKRLSSSPLIKVTAVDEQFVTFLIRGKMNINKSRVSPFVRMEARILKTDRSIDEVTTFIAELKITENDLTPVTEVRMGLGFDGLIFSGRGGARVVPIGFGLDIFLGGVSDRGIMLGIDVFLPAPIPLGPTGLGLFGIGGDYAHNFKPRLEAGLEAEGPKLNLETGETPDGTPVGALENPTAIHYLQWARNPDDALDRWVPAPANETAVGIGVRAFLCDTPSKGSLLLIEPAGFAVLTPGPIIILGGEGKLLNTDSIGFDAYAVIDAVSGSFSLGGGVDVRIPKSGGMVEAVAVFESFFSRTDPKTWFVRIGAEQDPARAKFLVTFSAKLYIELNHYRVAFGIEILWKEGFKVAKIFTVFVQGGGGIRGLLGWNPRQIAAELKLMAEVGFKVWKFKLSASLTVSVWGHVPQPKVLEATTKFKLNLPFPLKDAKIKVKLPRERDNQPPDIELPFVVNQRAGALHPVSGRQWDLAEPNINTIDQPWPDVELVIPFNHRLIDETGKVLGSSVGSETQGGYDVHHRLTRLELRNLTNDTAVEGVQAVWAEGPDGDTAQLHVLAQDPYSWLFWNESVASSLTVPEPVVHLQLFGVGPDETFDAQRRFGKVLVSSATTASLNNEFNFALTRRIISSTDMELVFRTGADQPIYADLIRFYVIEHRTLPTSEAFVNTPGTLFPPFPVKFEEIFPNLYLVTYAVKIPEDEALDVLRITSLPGAGPVNLYGVLLREVLTAEAKCQQKVILSPGRYLLAVEGTTTATSLDGLAEPDDQDWSFASKFDVVYPYSLRPYLRDTTVGDTRIIRDEKLPWNPTLFGIGFPAYRGYLPAVRFVVPYLSDLFPTLRFQLVYEAESTPDYNFTAQPVETANGENSLLEPSEDFLDWVGCPINVDQELEGLDPLTDAGPAEVQLIFDEPGGQTRRLDSWNCYVSQFTSFAEHITLSHTTLRQVYDTDGPRTISSCFTPGNIGLTARRSIGGARMDPILAATVAPPPNPTAPLLPSDFPLIGNPTFPDELVTPPLPWRLPTAMVQHLDDDATPLPVAFARFARASDVVFFDMPNNPHFGLANTVEETVVEAIVDAQGRPYALWLRTPEPVDWRRVNGALKIRHLKEDDGCSTEYAFRKPMGLTIEILPGPDASSVFIVGSLAGIRTRLPRGEYELTLSFDPLVNDLPRLRPGPEIEDLQETVMLKFLQVSGQTWPQPNAKVLIPAILLERIIMATDPEDPNMLDALSLAATGTPGAPIDLPPVAPPPVERRTVTLAARGATVAQSRQPRSRRPRVVLRSESTPDPATD